MALGEISLGIEGHHGGVVMELIGYEHMTWFECLSLLKMTNLSMEIGRAHV